MLYHLTGQLTVTPSNVHDSVQHGYHDQVCRFPVVWYHTDYFRADTMMLLYFSFQFRQFMTDTIFLNHLDSITPRRRADLNVSDD
ncbi:hypothetical protein B0T09DRAFT_162914 [Sordaria sp. MPI-SDFR-AT-0083]|nr:hypothetical protein B0T09DRAFT_162914 [Sordaria sp. MPI-SDFR-AT-0083]